jgi:hypothetical protein
MESVNNNTVDAAYRDSSEIVNAKYYEYIALLFTAILLIMLFFRFTSNNGIQSGGSAICPTNAFKIIIIILFIVFYFNRKKIYNQLIM